MDLSKKDIKILCTIGPSSSDIKVLRSMYKNGMNAIRLNTAHGDFKWYKKIINKTRKMAPIPIVVDIKGPELRIRCKENILIQKNEKIKIGFNDKINPHFNFNIISKLKKGDIILIQDGKFSFKVISKSKDHIVVKSKDNSIIEPDKNANVPNKSLDLPQLTPKDLKAIKFAIKEKVEYIALSFCRNKKDIINLRRKLGKSGIKIIAKIENREGIDNILEIIDAADGVMVARGDLGVELPPEEVPLIQKEIIKECNQKGKLVIVATQMLESMISHPVPTRAEISDIANAVLDGADCIMLSAETAIGKYPGEAVKIMSKVSLEVEPEVRVNINSHKASNISECISNSIATLTNTLPITKIICLTYSGHTASMIARFRLDVPIFAITSSEMVKRQLMLYYSIKPVCYKTNFWDAPIVKTIKYLYKSKLINKEDLLLFTAGLHTTKGKKTNTIQVHHTSELLESIKNKK